MFILWTEGGRDMRKLLIADCSEDYRIALAAALQDQYQVLHCRTGTEARDLLYNAPKF